jgi:predicted peptidase
MTDAQTIGIPTRTRLSRMTLWCVGLIIVGSLSVVAQSLDAYQDFSTENLPGRLYIPPEGEDPNALRPMIVALHGGGAIGNNNVGNIWDFEPLLQAAQSAGAFLYAPQSSSAYWHREDRPAAIIAQIDRAIERYGIDPNRISLTGFSMGGSGTWHLGSIYSDRFSAIMPICGIAPGHDYAAISLLKKPMWVFHARNDPSVAVDNSRNQINELLQLSDLANLQPPTRSSVSNFQFADESLNLK